MALVVDSSVRIDYFNGRPSLQTDSLDHAPGTQEIIMGELIPAGVLQGFRSDSHHARELLRDFPVVAMIGPDMAIRAAENYRAIRKHGVTIRKTIDIMIARYCIEHAPPLLYQTGVLIPWRNTFPCKPRTSPKRSRPGADLFQARHLVGRRAGQLACDIPLRGNGCRTGEL